MIYYRGLKEWNSEKGYLTDTCLTSQDKYKKVFGLPPDRLLKRFSKGKTKEQYLRFGK